MNEKFKTNMEIIKGSKEFYHGIAKKVKNTKTGVHDSTVIRKLRKAMFTDTEKLVTVEAEKQINTYGSYVDICKSRGIVPCEDNMYSDSYFVCQCRVDNLIQYVDKSNNVCGEDTSNINKFKTAEEAIRHAEMLIKKYNYSAGIKFITEYRKRKTVMTYAPELKDYIK